jgi:DNA-binding LacI/PurR family transcriptional regulator
MTICMLQSATVYSYPKMANKLANGAIQTAGGRGVKRANLPRARAANTLRHWLQNGRFAVSEILPTEQALCDQLQVSRWTVRAALRQLEIEGLILSQKGPGRLRGRMAQPSGSFRNSLMDKVVVLITDVPKPMPYVKGGLLYAMDSGAVTAIQEARMHLFVLHPDSLSEEDISRLIADAPLGVAVGSSVADFAPRRELLLRLCGRVPLVVAGNDSLWAPCDRVVSDHEAGTYALTNWLIQRGKKRILRLWLADAEERYWLHARDRGFERAMADAGYPLVPQMVINDLPHVAHPTLAQFEKNVRAVASHLIEYLVRGEQRVDTIMATSDSYACLIAAACRLFGLTPNKDVWIVGYDNFWPVAPERAFIDFIPLATVDKQNHTVGLKMIELLRRRIAGELPQEAQCILVEPELVVPDAASIVAEQKAP